MKRRLFVGHSALMGAGLSLGLKNILPSNTSEKLDQLQKTELAKFRDEIRSHLVGSPHQKQISAVLTTPTKILSKKIGRNDFLFQYQTAGNSIVTISGLNEQREIRIEAT